jgi:hypothetical protein
MKALAEPSFTPVPSGLVQRKCACGQSLGLASECGECREKRLAGRPPLMQSKLTIGLPGDKYEQEADQVAEQVMRMGDLEDSRAETKSTHLQVPGIQRKYLGAEAQLQRQADEAEEEEEDTEEDVAEEGDENDEEGGDQDDDIEDEEEETLQAKELPGSTPSLSFSLEESIQSLRGGGNPLPETTRNFFERRFGHDFGHVRIHADTQAASTAKALRARAFTLGPDIVFGAGQDSFDTPKGQRLLAHELTHVIQQGAAHAAGSRESSPAHNIQKMGEGPVRVSLKLSPGVVQSTPEECTFGEIEAWAVVSVANLAAPAGLADAKASIGAVCRPSNCNCVDGSAFTAPGRVAAWQNIVAASGGVDRTGGGNFMCVGNQNCWFVHRCRNSRGRLVRRTKNLTPSGTTAVVGHGTLFFYNDLRRGRCPRAPSPTVPPRRRRRSRRRT